MKILYLPLKKEWYEMVERGEKREEYREYSSFWKKRLLEPYDEDDAPQPFEPFKHFDAVCFSYGYTKRRMLWECKGITIGRGHPEWGAPDYEVFILKLGKRIEQ